MFLHARGQLEEYIINTLASKSEISTRTILDNLKRNHELYSIQAIYKELRKLQAAGMVLKHGKLYSLSLAWVLDFMSFVDTLADSYLRSPIQSSILPNTQKKKVWRFHNLLLLNSFWSHVLLMLVTQSKKKVVLGWNPYLWFHLAQTKQEERYIRSLERSGGALYLIIGSNTYLNRWAIDKFLNRKNITYSFAKSGFEKDMATYFNVIDDYVLTVKIDPKMNRAIQSLYSTASSEHIDFQKLTGIFSEKTYSTIWLEKNNKKATTLRKKFSKFFGTTL